MYIKCINNDYNESKLTINKIYKVLAIEPRGLFGKKYEIITDEGKYSYFLCSMFEEISNENNE